jgi:hypothetical protein
MQTGRQEKSCSYEKSCSLTRIYLSRKASQGDLHPSIPLHLSIPLLNAAFRCIALSRERESLCTTTAIKAENQNGQSVSVESSVIEKCMRDLIV